MSARKAMVHRIIVNDKTILEEIRKSVEGCGSIAVESLRQEDFPTNEPFLFVLKHHRGISMLFAAHSAKGWKAPIFVLDEPFNPSRSRDAWNQQAVVGYLVWNQREKEKTLSEIRDFVLTRVERMERVEAVRKSKITGLREIGAFVKIEQRNQEEENLISLFVGRMRDFMVELKLICDALRPEMLGENPVKRLDLLKAEAPEDPPGLGFQSLPGRDLLRQYILKALYGSKFQG